MEYESTKLNQQFELLKRLIHIPTENQMDQELSALNELMEKNLPKALGKSVPYFFSRFYFEMQCEYERFRTFLLNRELMGKRIVALGGGFSSGKSSFLNQILGKNILPAQIEPSTSIPTYIVLGSEERGTGLNLFNHKVPLSIEEIHTMAHGYGEDMDDETHEGIALASILKNIVVETPRGACRYIAFLDTPGYSKPKGYSAHNDWEVAKTQLNTSDLLLWFVPIDTGTITEEDLQFLSELRRDIPKIIVISKADKCLESSIPKVCAQVKKMLALKGITYEEVFVYSRTKPFDRDALLSYLARFNKITTQLSFKEHFSCFMRQLKRHYEAGIENQYRQLNRLNIALTFAEASVVTENLTAVRQEIMNELSLYKADLVKARKFEQLFFYELQKVADRLGICLIKAKEKEQRHKDLLMLCKQYKEKKDIREISYSSSLLFEQLSQIKPTARSEDEKNKLLLRTSLEHQKEAVFFKELERDRALYEAPMRVLGEQLTPKCKTAALENEIKATRRLLVNYLEEEEETHEES